MRQMQLCLLQCIPISFSLLPHPVMMQRRKGAWCMGSSAKQKIQLLPRNSVQSAAFQSELRTDCMSWEEHHLRKSLSLAQQSDHSLSTCAKMVQFSFKTNNAYARAASSQKTIPCPACRRGSNDFCSSDRMAGWGLVQNAADFSSYTPACQSVRLPKHTLPNGRV